MNKTDFPIFNNNPLIYLDNAATTQRPNILFESLREFYVSSNANVHRGIYELSEKATEEYEASRKIIARFINAKPSEIIFTSGTTMGINLISKYFISKLLNKEDAIVISILEHHSNLIPWQEICNEKNARLIYLPLDDKKNIDIDKLRDVLKENKVKAISLSHMSNVLGSITSFNKVREIIDELSPSTILISDSAQAAAHLDIDVKKLGVDILAFSSHKIYGPFGLGVLWVKEDIANKMEPFFKGGGMISHVGLYESSWDDPPFKFEAGTPSIADTVAFSKVIEYIEGIGKKNILDHERKLAYRLFNGLKGIKHINTLVEDYDPSKGPVISFFSDKMHPHDIVQKLSYKGFALRAGHHCAQVLHKQVFNINGSVRASIAIYNDDNDIDRLIEELKNIIKEGY